jgi:hypothetical protein
LSQNCDNVANDQLCFAQAACTEWQQVDQTIQQADADGDLTPLIRMQNGQNYINMLNDATDAGYGGSKWETLNNDAMAIDNAINSAEPGDQNALDQVAAASEQMGIDCNSTGASR